MPKPISQSRPITMVLVAVVVISAFYFLTMRDGSPSKTTVADTAIEAQGPEVSEATTSAAETVEETILEAHNFYIPALNEQDFSTIEVNGDTVYQFEDNNAATVTEVEQENVFLSGLSGVTEEELQLENGMQAVRVTGASQKDGSLEYMLLVYTDDGLLVFRGDSAFLDEVEANLLLP